MYSKYEFYVFLSCGVQIKDNLLCGEEKDCFKENDLLTSVGLKMKNLTNLQNLSKKNNTSYFTYVMIASMT